MIDRSDRKEIDDVGKMSPAVNLAPGWLPRVTYPIAGAVILALLVIHTFRWHRADVDYVSATLVGLLLVLPIAQYKKRLKWGQLEAEIDRGEVQKLRAVAADLPEAPIETRQQDVGELDVVTLARRDPALGLAKLRIELEQEIRKRYDAIAATPGRTSLSVMIREIEDAEVISHETAAVLRDVLPLANRAVHGEFVHFEDAIEIAKVGMRLLESLKAEQ